MGRRALRKIDPALDLSTHLLTWDDLPPVWDPVAVFGRAAPLEIEVGSGKGLFLATASAALPQHDFLGVEIARKYARFAAAKLARQQAANARLLHGDAQRLFCELLPGASVHAVHVYFPDPWWKKRHLKRRIMNPAFLRDAQRVLQRGGRLHFWTDVEAYFRESLDLIAAESTFEGPYEVASQPPAHDLDYRTHFERRMRLHEKPIYRAEFVSP